MFAETMQVEQILYSKELSNRPDRVEGSLARHAEQQGDSELCLAHAARVFFQDTFYMHAPRQNELSQNGYKCSSIDSSRFWGRLLLQHTWPGTKDRMSPSL